MVVASGYARARLTANRANSKPERSGVAKREMPTGFRLYRAEHIGRAPALALVIPFGFPPRLDRSDGTNIGVQGDRLLVQADHRLLGILSSSTAMAPSRCFS